MAKKGCGVLLFISVVTFCAFSASSVVWFISFFIGSVYVETTNKFLSAEFLFVYVPLFGAFVGALIGILWARAMLRSDKS